MAYRLLPTLRLARQLSRDVYGPFWSAPRPSFWWDYPRFPSDAEIFKTHFGIIDKLIQQPFESPRMEMVKPNMSSATFYRYSEADLQKPEQPSKQSMQQESETKGRQECPFSQVAEEFQVSLDLSEFNLEEIQVKLVGNNVLYVEAKHKSNKDGRDIKRYFSHYYNVPDNVDIAALKSTIDKNGILTMSAPFNKTSERSIPIQQSIKDADAARVEETPEDGVENQEDGNTNMTKSKE